MELRCSGFDGHFSDTSIFVCQGEKANTSSLLLSGEKREKHRLSLSLHERLSVRIWKIKKWLEQNQCFILNHLVLLLQQVILWVLFRFVWWRVCHFFVFHHILGGCHWLPGGSDHVPAHWNHGATEEPLWKTTGRLDGISVRKSCVIGMSVYDFFVADDSLSVWQIKPVFVLLCSFSFSKYIAIIF